jgi:sortase A
VFRVRFRNQNRLAQAGVIVELACWIAGVALGAAYVLSSVDRAIGSAHDVKVFRETGQSPDQSLWSPARVAEYEAALALPMDSPVAVLHVPRLGITVPVYPHSSELTLNRGTALIDGMARPDAGGNLGIAGHRDGFFRGLKDIRPGDAIQVRTRRRLHIYRVTSVYVVEAHDTELLADTSEPTITLVTCYPFYYVGRAPQRFVVSAAYDWNASRIPRNQGD